MPPYFVIDSEFLLRFLSPLRVSVSISDSVEVQSLRSRCAQLEAENKRLSFAYSCSSTLLGRFRTFCKDNGVSLPRDLDMPTPWG